MNPGIDMRSEKSKASDLFLLMLNLSQIASKDRIIPVFIEALTEIWPEIKVIFSESDHRNGDNCISISTIDRDYGYLILENRAALQAEDFDLLHNACGMLAIILNKDEHDMLLGNEKLHLQKLVEENNRHLYMEIEEKENAEQALREINQGLRTLNETAINLNSESSCENFYACIAHGLLKLTGGSSAVLSVYDPLDNALHIKYVDLEDHIAGELSHALGGKPLNAINFPLSREMHDEIGRNPISVFSSLSYASMGLLPEGVGNIIQKMHGIDRILGIAYLLDNELFGTSLVALAEDVPDISADLLRSFAQMSSVALRRIRAEEALRAREQDLRIITENIQDTLWLMDMDFKTTWISPSAVRKVGSTFGEFKGKPLDQYLTPESYAKLMKMVYEVMTPERLADTNTDISISADLEFNLKNGDSLWTNLVATILRDATGQPNAILAVGRDITERRKAQENAQASQFETLELLSIADKSRRALLSVVEDEKKSREELTRLNEELEDRVTRRTSQLETANNELEAFSYSVSHDLRAPLRALDGFSKILLEEYAPSLDAEGNRLLQIIGDNAQKMGHLIDDLLSFSRLSRQEINFSTIDMFSMAKSVFYELLPKEDREKTLFRLDPIPEAYGDPSMVRQVWMNLIGNAIKFSSLKPDRIIEIGSTSEGAENIYFIKDNGAGFDMTYSNKLFGVFQRLHAANDFEGTGVGLAIVKRIVIRMHGRVWAQGKINEGSVFYFTLPNRINK
jgi:PAS domain S-box-containing protein